MLPTIDLLAYHHLQFHIIGSVHRRLHDILIDTGASKSHISRDVLPHDIPIHKLDKEEQIQIANTEGKIRTLSEYVEVLLILSYSAIFKVRLLLETKEYCIQDIL